MCYYDWELIPTDTNDEIVLSANLIKDRKISTIAI